MKRDPTFDQHLVAGLERLRYKLDETSIRLGKPADFLERVRDGRARLTGRVLDRLIEVTRRSLFDIGFHAFDLSELPAGSTPFVRATRTLARQLTAIERESLTASRGGQPARRQALRKSA